MSAFIRQDKLEELFRSGRFQPKPTITMIEVGGGAGYPVEAIIGDRNGNPVGACWLNDLQKLMTSVADEKDTALSNPNLQVVTMLIREMELCRQSIAEMAVEIERQKATTVVPFKPRA